MIKSLLMLITFITLSWSPNDEEDLAGYKIYQGLETGVYDRIYEAGLDTILSVPHYNIDGDSTVPNYFVATAYDTANNESDYSEEAVWLFQDTIPPIDPVPLPVTPKFAHVDSFFVGNDSIFTMVHVGWEPYVDTMATALKLWDSKVENEWNDTTVVLIFYDIPPTDTVITYFMNWESNKQHWLMFQAVNRRHLGGDPSYFSELTYFDYIMPEEPDTTVVPPCELVGDINKDKRVDINDLILVVQDNGKSGTDLATDISGPNGVKDNRVDIWDIIAVVEHNGEMCP